MTKDYCEKYDSDYNTLTREWIEKLCDDPLCDMCPKRPKKHSKKCKCMVRVNIVYDTDILEKIWNDNKENNV